MHACIVHTILGTSGKREQTRKLEIASSQASQKKIAASDLFFFFGARESVRRRKKGL